MRYRSLISVIFAAGVIGCGAAGSASAECKGKPIFEDTFQTLDPSWGRQSEDMTAEKGALVLRPQPGYIKWALSQSDYYGDGSLCTDIKVVESADPGSTNAGVLFWATDTQNFYVANLGSDPNAKKGFFQVTRFSKGRWLTPIGWTPDPAVKYGLGETNNLEVQLKGRAATIFVNGKQVGQINGNPPEGGGLIGVIGASPEAGRARIEYQNFQFFPPAGFRP